MGGKAKVRERGPDANAQGAEHRNTADDRLGRRTLRAFACQHPRHLPAEGIGAPLEDAQPHRKNAGGRPRHRAHRPDCDRHRNGSERRRVRSFLLQHEERGGRELSPLHAFRRTPRSVRKIRVASQYGGLRAHIPRRRTGPVRRHPQGPALRQELVVHVARQRARRPPDASSADVKQAIRALGLLDRFLAFPEGLETEVHERGSRLSAGERQLIWLAPRRWPTRRSSSSTKRRQTSTRAPSARWNKRSNV